MTPVSSIPTLSILLNGNKWSEFFYLCTSRNSKKKDAQTLQRRSWFDCNVHRETFCFLVKTINICSGPECPDILVMLEQCVDMIYYKAMSSYYCQRYASYC